MMEYSQTAIDPLTQVKFIKTRSNQKFETRENQIQYNNLKAREKREAKAMLDRMLDKNRSVMKSLLAREAVVIKSQDFLLGAGFHFGCNTHTVRIENKKWSCVYEYGYTQMEDGNIKIIQLSNQ